MKAPAPLAKRSKGFRELPPPGRRLIGRSETGALSVFVAMLALAMAVGKVSDNFYALSNTPTLAQCTGWRVGYAM